MSIATLGAFSNEVAGALTKAGASYKRDVGVGGFRADFHVKGPFGRELILETKAWPSTKANLRRATHQAKLLRKTLKSPGAYIVVPGRRKGRKGSGVLTVAEVRNAVRGKPQTPGTRRLRRKRSMKVTKTGRVIFAAMPFKAAYDDVFFVAVTKATKGIKAAAKRVDVEDYVGDIVAKIKNRIKTCIAVVADLSEARPNVLYEMGYAQGKGKPVIPLCSTPLSKLPFDVRNLNVLEYTKGQTNLLAPKLRRRLCEVVPGP